MTKNEKQKLRRHNWNNYDTKKYEKTPNGFIMRLYRNMQSRITGVQKQKAHLYCGKELLSREDFYRWAKETTVNKFSEMFEVYKNSGYDRRFAPTVDRIDSKLGYFPENMQWLTHSENSRLGALAKEKVRYFWVNIITGEETYMSTGEIAKYSNDFQSVYSTILFGRRAKSSSGWTLKKTDA